MRKVVLIMLLLVIPTLLFSAGAKEEDVTTVTIWHSNSGILEDAFMSLVEQFNESHDNIRINAVYQGKANDVLTSVNAASLAGSGLPDIAQLDATAGLDMMYAPYLVTVEELGVDTSELIESAYAAYDSKRGHIGVPFNASSLLFYYNADLFEEAGVEVPKTLDDFISSAPIIHEKTGVYAFSGVPTTYENGTFRNFLEKWKALYDTGALNNLTSGVSNAFYAEQCASMLASSSNLTTVLENTDGLFNVGVAYVPMVDSDATGGVNIGGGCLAAFSNTEEVREVLEFMISASSQAYWAESTGYMPVNRNTVESPEWQAFIKENPLYSVALEQALSSSEKVLGLWIPSAYQVYYSFQSTIASVLEGEMSIDEAVSSMADMINTNLMEYARQNG